MMQSSGGRQQPFFSSSRLRVTPPWEAGQGMTPSDGVAALAEDSGLLKAVLGLRVGEGRGCEAVGSGEGGEGDGEDDARTDKFHQVGLSLGQQQLLCLARMLLQRRQFVLLDECTASIDPSTSTLMRQVRMCEHETGANVCPSFVGCSRR